MNQNKQRVWQCFSRLLPYFILVVWAYLVMPRWNAASIGYDFIHNYYVPGKSPSDWFPPIMWVQLRCFDLLSLGDYRADTAARLFGNFWFLLLFSSLVMLVRHLREKQMSPYCLLLMFVCIVQPTVVTTRYVSIDMAFAAYLSIAMVFVHLRQVGNVLLSSAFLMTLVLIAVLHRTNGLLLIPVVFWYATIHWPDVARMRRAKRIGFVLLGTLGVLGLVHLVNYGLIGARRAHPEVCMMQSDVYCTDLLKGVAPCKSVEERFGHGKFHITHPAWGDSGKEICGRYGIVPEDSGLRALPEYHQVWKEGWFEAVTASPFHFLMARSVLTSQFFLQGECPEFLADFIRRNCPDATDVAFTSPYADKIILPSVIAEKMGVTAENVSVRQVVIFIYLGSLLVLPCLYLWRRRDLPRCMTLRFSLFSYVISFVYSLSFLPFVPTPDCRYLTPSIATWSLAVGFLVTYWCEERRKRC